MRRIDAAIIGGGQAGLAISRCLSDRAVDHVVIERGRVAERWRSERWNSLRLLTPNWQSRLPGYRYEGPDPHGFMTMAEVIEYLQRYAASFGAPVVTDADVLSVDSAGARYRIETTNGAWLARHVVIATGYSDLPSVPRMAARIDRRIVQVTPSRYRRPEDLPDGGVLVVGASATGVQLADEIHASGRPVTLAVGRHMRLPRRYRGRDILWWLDRMGIFSETVDQVYDVEISRSQPSFQLVGREDHASLDLSILSAQGVRMVGRALGADGVRVWCDDDFAASTASSDAKLALLLRRVDRFVDCNGLADEVGGPEPFVPCWPAALAQTPGVLDLRAEGIRTIVWATGFRRAYPWLRVPVLDARGEIQHVGGVTPAPGLYVLGFHFQRRRNSAFIDGVGADAAEMAARIALQLDSRRADAAPGRGLGNHVCF